MGSNFGDEIDNLSLFENMDDLVEFPSDNNYCNAFIGSGDCNDFTIWDEPFPDTDNIFSGTSSDTASELPARLPDNDMTGLNWYTTFMEDKLSGYGSSFAESLYLKEEVRNYQFQTSSPVSVLESSSTTSSSSSCSGEKVIPRGSQRARSKRPRPATFNPRPVISLTSPTSSFSGTLQPFGFGSGMPSESDNFAESGELIPKPKPEAAAIMMTTTMEELPKKNKKKLKIAASPLGASPMDNINETATVAQAQAQAQAVRKCLHCEITKTPQWRAGPMGPKTLCNACGVRYKSGRLFPEYRPAASPTFVPSLHSNSHKKVIEMRNKEVCNSPPAAAAAEAESSLRCVAADSNPSSSSAVKCM